MWTVVIDPGHGGDKKVDGSNPVGAIGPTGEQDKQHILDIALQLHQQLKLHGRDISVVELTRKSDVNLTLRDRVAVAKKLNADVFLSIHLNGFKDPAVQGTETHVWPDKALVESRDLAKWVQNNLVSVTGLRNRGLRDTHRWTVLNPALHAPDTAACIAHVCFITDPAEEARLKTAAYRKQIAAGLADAVITYLGERGRRMGKKGGAGGPTVKAWSSSYAELDDGEPYDAYGRRYGSGHGEPAYGSPSSFSVNYKGVEIGKVARDLYWRVDMPDAPGKHKTFPADVGGLEIELRFAANTGADAVKALKDFKEIRWIQVAYHRSDLHPPIVARHVDPGSPDERTTENIQPFYWTEAEKTQANAGNQSGYDIAFIDTPNQDKIHPITTAGKRNWNQFELCLVGVKDTPVDDYSDLVILKTWKYGYDILTEGGKLTTKLAALREASAPSSEWVKTVKDFIVANKGKMGTVLGAGHDYYAFGTGDGDGDAWPWNDVDADEMNFESHAVVSQHAEAAGSYPYGMNSTEFWLAVASPFEAMKVKKCASRAFAATGKRFPGKPAHNNDADAYRHGYWNICMANDIGAARAKVWADAHEAGGANPPGEKAMDLHNNLVGRRLAKDPASILGGSNPTYSGWSAESLLDEALKQGRLQTSPGTTAPSLPGTSSVQALRYDELSDAYGQGSMPSFPIPSNGNGSNGNGNGSTDTKGGNDPRHQRRLEAEKQGTVFLPVKGIENVSETFKDIVFEIAEDIGCDVNDLMAVMSFESAGTFSPSIKNAAGSGATGLIQFMPSTAKTLGTTTEALAKMTAEEQLEWVWKYFKPVKGRLKSLDDTYMAVLYPAAIGKGGEHVLFSEPSKAYEQNKGLDSNKDGKVTVAEAAGKVRSILKAAQTKAQANALEVEAMAVRAAERTYGGGLGLADDYDDPWAATGLAENDELDDRDDDDDDGYGAFVRGHGNGNGHGNPRDPRDPYDDGYGYRDVHGTSLAMGDVVVDRPVIPMLVAGLGTRTTAQAQEAAKRILDYIRTEAKTRAKKALSIDRSSKFFRRLEGHYLAGLFAQMTSSAAADAIALIGKEFAGPATPGDYWEESALKHWNKQPIPAAFRVARPELPAALAAATDILSKPNRVKLPYIDVPFLVGANNGMLGPDADVAHGGKNISQLMHWGTGVKYSSIPSMTAREIFLAYELWHLEAWDVFGEDPINDLISEDAGRIMGVQITNAQIDTSSLLDRLNEGFAEARAWVGSLLRIREKQLDELILAESPRYANMWWDTSKRVDVWGSETLFTKLKAGEPEADVKTWDFTQRLVGIYTVRFAADEWEKAHGAIKNSSLIVNMADGTMDAVFKGLAGGQSPKSLSPYSGGGYAAAAY